MQSQSPARGVTAMLCPIGAAAEGTVRVLQMRASQAKPFCDGLIGLRGHHLGRSLGDISTTGLAEALTHFTDREPAAAPTAVATHEHQSRERQPRRTERERARRSARSTSMRSLLSVVGFPLATERK